MDLRGKIALFVTGLVAGALLFAIAPVGAHHNDANLKNRVSALENKVKNLTTNVGKLKKKTSNLAANGDDYFGFVNGYYVWSNSDFGCTDGAATAWNPIGTSSLLHIDCPGGSGNAPTGGAPTGP